MMLSCKEVVRLMSQGLDRELAFDERLRLRAHYALCRGCSNVRDQFAFLRRAMQKLTERGGSAGD